MTFPKEIFPGESSVPSDGGCQHAKHAKNYRYLLLPLYLYFVWFTVEIKAHKSGDPKRNKAPEAEVPEGTDGPQQLIGQILQERWTRGGYAAPHTHHTDIAPWAVAEHGLSAPDSASPGKQESG